MSERVPEGWKNTTIGDAIVDIADGGTPSTTNPEYFGGDIPWVVIDDIQPRITQTKSTITDLGLRKSSTKLWDKGTIILSTGATIGEVGIAFKALTTKQGICGIVPKDDVSADYFYHLLVSKKRQLNTLSQGSTIKETRPPTIKRIQINLPPLPEQKKIASILTSVDEVIENTQKQIDKLQDLKKATMNELLTKGIGHTEFKDSELGRIPKSWEVKSIEQLVSPARPVTYGIVQAGKHIEGGVPYIRVSDMKSNKLHSKDMLRTSHEIASKFARSRVQEGDIVYALRGDIGKVLLVPKNLEGANLTQGTALISKSDNIETGFFIWCFSGGAIQKQTKDLAKGSTFAEMTLGNLKGLKTVIPPYGEQVEISGILNSCEESINKKTLKLSQTQSLKKSLMQDLLTGKVRVQVN